MPDSNLPTNAEALAIERDAKQAIEAAVVNVEQPRRDAAEVRRELSALLEEESQSTIARQFAYGYVRLDTDVVFREVDRRGRLHLVAAVAGDEIEEIAFWEIDGTLVEPSSQVDAHGTVVNGRFEHIARLLDRRGAPGQEFIRDLRHETSVDSSFRGTGIAFVYGRFQFRQGQFSGDPKIRVIARARKPIDPRDGVQRWTINPIVHAYDLLIKPKRLGGAERSIDEIGVPSFQAGADLGEEIIREVKQFTRTTRAGQFADDQLLFPDFPVLDFQYGDVVQLSADAHQTLPAALAPNTDYHVIPRRHRIGEAGEIGFPSLHLAASFADAMAGILIPFGLIPTDFQVKKVGEVRYACSAAYRGRFSRNLLEGILATCGAKLTNRGGKIALVPQVFPDTVKTISVDDIEGNITLSNKVRRNDRTTSLTGRFVSPARLFQPDDYPAVGGAVFETQDRGSFPKRFDLDFVPKVSTAQRQARFELNQRRQERTLAFAGMMRRYDVSAGDVFTLDYPRLGLDAATPFRCTTRRTFVEITNGSPKFRLDFDARQLEATTFDPDASAEQLILASKLPNIVDPRIVQPPSAPQISERQFETIEGAGVRLAVTMVWERADEPFFEIYQPRYKLSSDTDFIDLPRTTNLSREILDLAPGLYDFEVVTINSLGIESVPATTSGVQINGLEAAPVAITGFNVQINGTSALLSWDRHPDLDVRVGGRIEIRHHCDVDGGQSGNSVQLAGGTVNGDATFAQVSALVGTYYIRAFDQLGIAGPFVERSTDNVRPVPFAQLISGGVFSPNDSNEGLVTLAEAPAWASINPANTVTVDRTSNVIKLRPKNLISGEALFSAIPLVSAVGSIGDVEPEGVYHFFTRMELDELTRMRIEVELATEIVNEEDVFTLRPGLVSDFISFSGIIDPSVATAFMEARFTRDDPNASPVWSPWERVESRIFFHRAIEFRVQLRSNDPAFNILVSQAAVRARELSAAA